MTPTFYFRLVGASKGSKTKLIKGGNDSISALVDELLTSDMFAATIEPDLELTTPADKSGGAYKLFGKPEETAPWDSHFVGTSLVVDFSRPLP